MPYVEYEEAERVCAECGRLFRSDDALDTHREEAHGTGSETAGKDGHEVSCGDCAARFYSAASLADHRRRLHPSRE